MHAFPIRSPGPSSVVDSQSTASSHAACPTDHRLQYQGQIWKSAAPDFTITPLVWAQDGGSLLCEILAWGTHTEVLMLPAGDLPPTGREFGGKGVGIFEVRDGRLAAQRIYFDRLILVEQLGIPVPAPVG